MSKRLVTLIATLAMLTFGVPAGADPFPETVPLPNGIGPEGIATGTGTEFFVGSLVTGAIYKGDLRTGSGEFINGSGDFPDTRIAVGLDHDTRSDALWVAGGPTGAGYVYDADTGETIEDFQFSASGSFVNDVVVTRTAAFFTDSFRPVVYKVPLDVTGLPAGPAETLTLGGDFEFIPGEFNANGVDATPDGGSLVVVNSTTGQLYLVDPDTGSASLVDLGADSVPAGDGILLDGKTLYVVQNALDQIAVVSLTANLTSGELVDALTSPGFMVPTTVAEHGNTLYAVNARFGVTPGPSVEYDVVAVEKR